MPAEQPTLEPDWLHAALDEVAPYRGRYWYMNTITGPYDLAQLVRVREWIAPYVDFGTGQPHDVFVLSIGEPPVRSWTKIGGLPFWRRDRPWPRGNDGQRLPFLAQINFRQSRDLVAGLPGDLLLVFARPDLSSGYTLEWENVSNDKQLVEQREIAESAVPAFHGFRWRGLAFPDAAPLRDEYWSRLTLQNGEDVYQIYNAFRLLATQIGPTSALPPEYPPGGSLLHPGDQIICTVASISPLPDQPHPFVDHAAPIEEADLQRYRLVIDDYDSDKTGMLLVTRHADNTFTAQIIRI